MPPFFIMVVVFIVFVFSYGLFLVMRERWRF